MEREEGWYWVKIKGSWAPLWEAAVWDGLEWGVTNSSKDWQDRDFSAIGPKIEPPE